MGTPQERRLLQKEHNLRQRGGSLSRYRYMYAEQGGKCKLCGKSQNAGRALTFYPNGLVCMPCACRLHLVQHDPDRAERIYSANNLARMKEFLKKQFGTPSAMMYT